MKKLTVLALIGLTAGCSSALTVPQDLTHVSDIDREYTVYNHSLDGPTVETRSFFSVEKVELTENGELLLSGHFTIGNKKYLTETPAKALFQVEFENLGDDRVAISHLVAKDVSLYSIHKPIASEVHQVFQNMTRMLSAELKGEIITEQTRLGLANRVNETFKF